MYMIKIELLILNIKNNGLKSFEFCSNTSKSMSKELNMA